MSVMARIRLSTQSEPPAGSQYTEVRLNTDYLDMNWLTLVSLTDRLKTASYLIKRLLRQEKKTQHRRR